MTRILFFVSSMQGGGAERVAALLCNRWAAQGHDVMLVPTFSGRGTCIYPLDERIKLTYLADRVAGGRKTPWALWRRLREMRRLVRVHQAKTVMSFLTHVNVAALLATRGLNVRVVVSERIYPVLQELGPIWKLLRKFTFPWADHVVMQTGDGLQWLDRVIPRANGTVVANPSVFPLPDGTPRIAPEHHVSGQRRLLLAVGSLAARKQFGHAIAAFGAVCADHPDWDLAIVGEGPERGELQAIVRKQGLTNRVHMPCRAGNLGDWYARADLFVLSSEAEGFPNVLMEALSYGVPAVSYDCATGPADLIAHGANGFLVAPETGAAGLAQRLAELMADAAMRASFAARARNIHEDYGFEAVGAAWDRLVGVKDR